MHTGISRSAAAVNMPITMSATSTPRACRAKYQKNAAVPSGGVAWGTGPVAGMRVSNQEATRRRSMGLHCTPRGVTVNRCAVTMSLEGTTLRFSVIASALVAALVGFGSTIAIIVEATRHLGATPAQTSSWVFTLCAGMGLSTAYLCMRYRMPIMTAWSLAGALLIIAAPDGTTMGHAVSAFMFAAVLTVLAGVVPALGSLIARLPASIAGGMLAGLLLRFALGLFIGAQTAPGLVLPLVGVFLLARVVHRASAPLIVIVIALPLAWLEGYPLPSVSASLPQIAWMPPEFSLATLVSLGIPLFLVTMATQQISGAAVLRISGYTPPVSACFVVT
ncbi:MAG: hypothetical protein EOO78_12950, partial [Oxalobacteraceae bacterium]